MDCGCESGFRDDFFGVIVQVVDKADAVKFMTQRKSWMPPEMYVELMKLLDSRPDASFGVVIKADDGSIMSISGGEYFPQTIEWARGRVGRRLKFIVTQLPNHGGLSVDMAEVADKKPIEICAGPGCTFGPGGVKHGKGCPKA